MDILVKHIHTVLHRRNKCPFWEVCFKMLNKLRNPNLGTFYREIRKIRNSTVLVKITSSLCFWKTHTRKWVRKCHIIKISNKSAIYILMYLKLLNETIDKSSVIWNVLLEHSIWISIWVLHMVNVCLSYLHSYLLTAFRRRRIVGLNQRLW